MIFRRRGNGASQPWRLSAKLLIISSVMTVASLFFDFTPSFTRCMVATTNLGLVKGSAVQMAQKL